MIELTERERDEIAQLYVVANTPLMLYTALSASVAVQEVLCSRPQSDLVSLYASLGNISSPDEFGVSLSYATLVAILIKHGREGGPGDLPIDAGRLKWGAQMERYSRAREVNTGMLDIDAGYGLHAMTPRVDGPVSVVEAETQ
ncbi:MAG: hypothetical protein FJY85_24025, partial [Deltaproteobacteria bacterium]|nr:hypothetical protein [Deltaproteobacteria bacterium]